MDNLDNFRERFDALEQQTEHLKHQTQTLEAHTHAVERRLRWWRGLACGILALALLSWGWPSHQAPDASAAKTQHEDTDRRHKDHKDKGDGHHDDDSDDVEQRLQALEDKLAALTFDADANEVVITGANLRIVNGLGRTDCGSEEAPVPDCPNGLGNLVVGYNELRNNPGFPDVRTGSHNVVVGQQHNFSRFGGLVVGEFNTISGDFAAVSGGLSNTASGRAASVSGGNVNTASGGWSSVSGGQVNTAEGVFASVSGGLLNVASGIRGSVSGGNNNTASGFESSVSGGQGNKARGNQSSVSGGLNRTAPGEHDWVAGSLFEDE